MFASRETRTFDKLLLTGIVMLVGCGGGGSTEGAPAPSEVDGGSGAVVGVSARFVTWWRDFNGDGFYTQESGDQKGNFLSVIGTTVQGSDSERPAVANVGADSFVIWWAGGGGAGTPDGHLSSADLFSVADIQRQKGSSTYATSNTQPIKKFLLEGVWENIRMSHQGRYLAGAWAATVDRQTRGDADLTVIDLTAPEASAETVYDAPGGAGEKVDTVQWVSDNQFMVRNKSGRKFLWTVDTERYLELKRPPATFNGYTIVSEVLAPDGLKYGGLMSRDGGSTFEAWVASADYADMRQLTNAGLKLDGFQWLGSSKLAKFNLGTSPTSGNKCANAMIDPTVANGMSAPQLQSSPVPQNLPCAFEATAP